MKSSENPGKLGCTTVPLLAHYDSWRETMNASEHAVLDDAGLHFVDATQEPPRWAHRVPPQCRHAGDLLTLAAQLRLARIWLTPGSQLSQSLAESDQQAQAFVAEARSAGWDVWANDDHDFLSGWPVSGGAQAQVGIPERSNRWIAFKTCTDATTLYAAIQYLQELLGVAIAWGPGHVGLDLIKQVNRGARRADYLRLCDKDLELFVRYAREYRHTPLFWARPLSESERHYAWLHRYDKNNAYVGAASSANLGAGDYVHQSNPQFDPKAPGVWHIILSGESIFNGRDLPHPTDGRIDSWQHTQTVKVAIDVGYQVKIVEAYVFPEYHQTLRPWYEAINTARTRLRAPGAFKHAQAQAIAYEALKNIYTSSLGNLAGRARAEKNDPMYRPDWWFGIVDSARAGMFWKMRQLAEAGYRPVAVHTDAFYFVSQEADPRLAVPGLLTEEQGIGKFKHVDSFRLEEIGVEYFTSRIATLQRRLVALGAEEGGEDG